MIGAGQALRQAHNIPIQPADRADYERLLAWARGLGEGAVFDAALAEGLHLSLAEVAALATTCN